MLICPFLFLLISIFQCAIRTLKIDAAVKGVFVFPQRGKEEWPNWGYSNSIKVYLNKGINKVSLSFEPSDNNMNGEINRQCLILSVL